MEYIIGILQRQWNINADDMEYMILGSSELEEAEDKQRKIENAIIILNDQ